MSDIQLKILEDTIRRLKEREESIKKPSPKWENVLVSIAEGAQVLGKNVPVGTFVHSAKYGFIYPSKDLAETKLYDKAFLMAPDLLGKLWKYTGAYPLEE